MGANLFLFGANSPEFLNGSPLSVSSKDESGYKSRTVLKVEQAFLCEGEPSLHETEDA